MNDITLYGRSTSPFDEIRRTDDRGEYWLARELQPLLGYDQWGAHRVTYPVSHQRRSPLGWSHR